MSLEWYLNYKLKDHFYNDSDSFKIFQGVYNQIKDINTPEWQEALKNKGLMPQIKEGALINPNLTYELLEETYVSAPAIFKTVNYTSEDYERDIRNIMSKYMINFSTINIVINNQN